MVSKTEFYNNYISRIGFKLNGVYVPKGTIADLIHISCDKHKKCKCPHIYRLQGLVKKDIHSVGKPFSVDIINQDDATNYGFDACYSLADYPTSFSYFHNPTEDRI